MTDKPTEFDQMIKIAAETNIAISNLAVLLKKAVEKDGVSGMAAIVCGILRAVPLPGTQNRSQLEEKDMWEYAADVLPVHGALLSVLLPYMNNEDDTSPILMDAIHVAQEVTKHD